jgi:hypothetical protein
MKSLNATKECQVSAEVMDDGSRIVWDAKGRHVILSKQELARLCAWSQTATNIEASQEKYKVKK